jgi:hypothetical protein
VLGLAGIGLLRLALGLATTAIAICRSRLVVDPELRALANDLARNAGCRRRIEVRESDRVGSAATAGWLRPVVLLSPAWRFWSADERQAALAHEIAHVTRGDFLSRLLVRLAVAIHGYHPLLRWLAARLELRQEMAADALASRLCGGRSLYLKCLAALALKADARSLGPVPTFLTRPKTLLRRIAMLHVTDDYAPRTRRWPVLVTLAMLAAVALGFRGATPESLAGPIIPARFVEKKERPPLDVTYILPSDNADEVGVFAVRVGELCRVPGMDKMAEVYAAMIGELLGDKKKPHFALADIEQIAGRVTLRHEPEKPSPNHSFGMSLTCIRMAKDFDWPKQLQDWTKDWKEHTYAGTKYYSGKVTLPMLGFVNTNVWFYLPDSRTVVLEGEENIKKLIDAKGKPAKSTWTEDWKTVEGEMFGLVLPDLKGKLAKKLTVEKGTDKTTQAVLNSLAAICKKASRAAIGVDIGEGCSFKLRLACANAADAADVDEGCQSLAKLAEMALEDEKDEPKDAFDKAGRKLSIMLVRGIEFGKTVDHVVEVRMSAKTGVAELLKAFDASSGAK